ncbi:MAG: NAD(P)-binding protein [Rhizobiales bacterium]|nr:NAD(P)-binding protein [Hyphomicrobiales bacterium]
MQDIDVAVVGAGAAGLAAARRLTEFGLTTRLFEAKARIGGRTFTDTETFGFAWDRGAHWLHSADVNPLTRVADALGHEYYVRPEGWSRSLHLGARWAEEAERQAFTADIEASFEAAHDMGMRGLDVAVSEAPLPDPRWQRLARHWHEAISAFPPEEISTLDLARYRDTEKNWPLVKGYGALVAAYGAGLPVSLSTPVTAIEDLGSHVVVTTASGPVRARAVIVTLSTNVLASGAIRFKPGLPDALQAALEVLPTGTANKVALSFSRDVFGMPDTSYVNYMDERDVTANAFSIQIRPFGHEFAIAYLGGHHAHDLELAGEAAMTEVTRDALASIFGSDMAKSLLKTATTAWGTDPYTLGAYSCARPGHADARKVLREPVSEHVFLAGEAVSQDWFSTVHGAYLTGIDAAEKVADAIGHRTQRAVA